MYMIATNKNDELRIIIMGVPNHAMAMTIARNLSEIYNDPNVFIESE